ncbi:MAG: hypothetical protein HUU20_26700 [Pirellulales bacterium]|nr:hypothetical protein [Pirellulales bacterium]
MTDILTKCEVCRSLLDEEDLFCSNCGTEPPRRQEQPSGDPGRISRTNFECSGCGASMSYDAGAAALRCPFCGSVDMLARPDIKTLAPRRVVSFQVGRQEAEDAMRQWLGRGFWRPGDLARQAALVEMTPVYVPYWVFHAHTHTFWTADTDRTPPGARGDWYPLAGEHHGHYAGLLIGASGALTPHETAAICPFDLTTPAAPDEVDLDNVTVEQFSMPRKYARPLARQGLEQSESQAVVAAYVPGRARNVHVNVRIEALESEPVLLPVWIVAYRYRDRLFRFLLNGQSGRAAGQAPTSWSKVVLVAGMIVVGIVLIGLIAFSMAG